MPAASEPPRESPPREPPPDLPITWRPLGPRIAGAVAGGALLAVTTLLWLGFDQETKDSVTTAQRITVVGFFLLGFACLYAIGRSRARALPEGLLVVNGYRKHQLEWAQIVAVHLTQGAPWVVLDLSDGNALSVLGIQSTDGARALRAVRQLRALVDRANAPGH